MNPPAIEFHNVPVIEPCEYSPGIQLVRYPREIRSALSHRGRFISRESTGVELRFVTPAQNVRIFLSSEECDIGVTVFRGNFSLGNFMVPQGRVHCLHVVAPEVFPTVHAEALQTGSFSPEVWRFVCDRSSMVFHGLDTFGHEVRPPSTEEKPRLRWLAYGSSITHSSARGYPQQAAMRLGLDVLNKGLSGACEVEPEVADFLATGCEWDFATLELGVNIRRWWPPHGFEERARYMVTRCLEAKPGRPIVLITVFPNCAGCLRTPDISSEREVAYNEILRKIAADHAGNGVHLIEGSDVLSEFHLLSQDLLHPSEFGHVRMGENLAERLRPIIENLQRFES